MPKCPPSKHVAAYVRGELNAEDHPDAYFAVENHLRGGSCQKCLDYAQAVKVGHQDYLSRLDSLKQKRGRQL